jgi:hypothetical protein
MKNMAGLSFGAAVPLFLGNFREKQNVHTDSLDFGR